MSVDKKLTPIELHRKGIEALTKVLGSVDAIRFIQLYDNGSGDFTAERREYWEGRSNDEFLKEFEDFQNQ